MQKATPRIIAYSLREASMLIVHCLCAQQEEDAMRRRRKLLQRGPFGRMSKRLKARERTAADINALFAD